MDLPESKLNYSGDKYRDIYVSKIRQDEVFIAQMTWQRALKWSEVQRITSQHYLISLARLRNAYLPVGNLPPEILSEIFVLLYESRNRPDYIWDSSLVLSHVCYVWRTVALSLPSLWRLVSLHNKPMARMRLGRCGMGGIHVLSHARPWRFDAETKAEESDNVLDPYMEQVERLLAWHTTDEMRRLLLSLQGHLLPSLTCVSLDIPPEGKDNGMYSLEWDPHHRDFPTLDSLTLCGVHVPMCSSMFLDLVYLQLHYQRPPPAVEQETITDLVSMLEECPRLMTLNLKYCGPQLPDDVIAYPEPVRVISLHCLQKLVIEDDALVVAQILGHISLPPSTSVSIIHSNGRCGRLEDVVPATLPRNRTRFTQLAEAQKFTYHVKRNLEISFTVEPNKFDLKLFVTIPDLENDGDDIGAISVMNDHNRRVSPFLLTNLLIPEMSSLESVEEIEVRICEDHGLQTSQWDTMLALLPSLRSVTYGYEITCSTDGFALCLSLTKVDDHGNLLCPSLEHLELQDFLFEQHRVTSMLTVEEMSRSVVHGVRATEDMGPLLIECLRLRASLGHRLKRLKLKDTILLKEETVELMRPHVDDLEWEPSPPPPPPPPESPPRTDVRLPIPIDYNHWFASRDEDDEWVDLTRSFVNRRVN